MAQYILATDLAFLRRVLVRCAAKPHSLSQLVPGVLFQTIMSKLNDLLLFHRQFRTTADQIIGLEVQQYHPDAIA
jgi:hypothetical protein